jgi:hypothetical protein
VRLSLVLPLVALSTLLSSAAFAQGTPFGNGTNSTKTSSDDDETDPLEPDKPKPYYERKDWSLGSSFETNRTLLSEDVGGRIKAFNTLSLYAAYNLTKKDQVRATGGFIQRFIADQSETGFRTDDVGASYARKIPLPGEIMLAPSVGAAFPTSFQSQLMSLIVLPRAGVYLGRAFLDGTLMVSLRGGAAYYVVKYKEAKGQADANPQATTFGGLNINYAIPFHQALQIGVSGSTSYTWQYDVDHANDPTLREQFRNTPVEPSADPYYARSAPAQQGYGGEVYVSYSLPQLQGLNSQFQVSLSQNDGVLRDGATHLYWLSRRGGQLSASLTVSY